MENPLPINPPQQYFLAIILNFLLITKNKIKFIMIIEKETFFNAHCVFGEVFLFLLQTIKR